MERGVTISETQSKAVWLISILAVCLGYVAPVYAVSEVDDVTPPPDTYFDFAVQDEARIYTRGVWPDDAERILSERQSSETLLAENDVDTPPPSPTDTASEAAGGHGGGLGEEIVFDAPQVSSYRVADLSITCDIAFCDDPQNRDALLRASGLTLGRLATTQELSLSVERLRKTGFFSHIHQTLTYDGNHVHVTFEAVGHIIIDKIHYDVCGNWAGLCSSLFKSDLKKRMILHAGGALYPRTALLRGRDVDSVSREELTKIALDDQINSLTRVYTKQGFLDASVTIDVVPSKDNPKHVDLKVVGHDVDGYVLGKVYVRGLKAKSYADIESEFRSGFSFFGNATKEQIEDSVSDVLKFYRESGYYQARIKYVSRQNPDTRTIDVFLDIEEGKHWSVRFKGNMALSDKELSEVLTFQSSGYIDRGELSASEDAVRALYVSAGYYWADVKGELPLTHYSKKKKEKNTSDEISSLQTNMITMTVTEGPHMEIGEIVFEGLRTRDVTREMLLKAIGSKEYSAFGGGAYPQRAMIADDAAKIIDTYRERGYLNAEVDRWMLIPREDGRMQLKFIIREGERSYLAHRQIRYTDRPQYEDYDVLIDAPQDNYFSDYVLRAESAAITKQLRARGYATISERVRCVSYGSDGALSSLETCDIADIPISCYPADPAELCTVEENAFGRGETCYRHYATENNEPDGAPCILKDGITGQIVDVEYEITLGPKYTFGDIFTHGNVVTRDYVIRQDIAFEREQTFDYNKIMDTRSLLRQRKIYHSATLNVIGVDDDLVAKSDVSDSTGTVENPVPVVIDIEEAPIRWFDVAVGLSLNSNDWLLTGEMEYVNANLYGSGIDLRVLLMPELRLSHGSENVAGQRFNQNWFSLLTVTVPLLPMYGLDLVTQLFYDLRYIPETNKLEYGGLVELQWDITKTLFAAFAFEAKASNTSSFGIDVSSDIDSYSWICYPVPVGGKCPFDTDNRVTTVSFKPRISYDGRDSPLNPKDGVYLEGNFRLAYSSSAGLYFQPDIRAAYVYTFLDYFTLGFNLRMGLSFLDADSTVPLIDRYFLGGLSVRGYDNDALGPRLVNTMTPNIATNEAAGGEALFNFNAELRYPIWNSVGLFGAVFVDLGSIVEHQPLYSGASRFFKEMFVEEMRYTAGLGLRWLISDSIPPVVIDYGFILNRRRGDPIGRLSLNIGYTF